MRILVLSPRRYNGKELWEGLGALVDNDIEFELLSTHKVIVDENTARPNRVSRTYDEFDPATECAEFDGLMVVSGNTPEVESMWHHPVIQDIVKQMSGKPMAAICMAVPVLHTQVADKQVSTYPILRARYLLEDSGATVRTVSLTRDGNLVTAEHDAMSPMWAEEFVRLLQGKEQELVLEDTGYMPKGRDRKPVPEVERLKGDN